MMAEFEWDSHKAAGNLRKHGVSFEEAEAVFDDPGSLATEDAAHSGTEERFRVVGISNGGRVLVVSYCYRGVNEELIRIINARKATKAEIRQYEQRKA